MNFEESVGYLLGLGHETLALKLGLRNTELLLEALGNPHQSYESIQIAGTNGKGSTAVVLDSICCAAGISTGLYTSPHLVSITERITTGGQNISAEDFAKHATRVRSSAENLVALGKIEALPTFFEHVTAIALVAFREAGVRLAILETGLGGRLDATTVAGARTVAITAVSLDHQEHLGETLEEIAAEKAAIIRAGVTAVIAPQTERALKVILKRCHDFGVNPLIDQCQIRIESVSNDGRLVATFETKEGRYERVLVGLRGRHQLANVTVAIQLAESLRRRGFEIPKAAIIKGIEESRHAGRLELHEGRPSLLLDGAHNPEAARVLREYLDEFTSRPLTLVFGAMKDKNLDEMASMLFPVAEHVILVQPDNPRAALVENLLRLASNRLEAQKIFAAHSVAEAMQKARDLASPDGLICVTGSLYLVGEVSANLEPAAAGTVVSPN